VGGHPPPPPANSSPGVNTILYYAIHCSYTKVIKSHLFQTHYFSQGGNLPKGWQEFETAYRTDVSTGRPNCSTGRRSVGRLSTKGRVGQQAICPACAADDRQCQPGSTPPTCRDQLPAARALHKRHEPTVAGASQAGVINQLRLVRAAAAIEREKLSERFRHSARRHELAE